jgi:hypothetical protein
MPLVQLAMIGAREPALRGGDGLAQLSKIRDDALN